MHYKKYYTLIVSDKEKTNVIFSFSVLNRDKEK